MRYYLIEFQINYLPFGILINWQLSFTMHHKVHRQIFIIIFFVVEHRIHLPLVLTPA